MTQQLSVSVWLDHEPPDAQAVVYVNRRMALSVGPTATQVTLHGTREQVVAWLECASVALAALPRDDVLVPATIEVNGS